MDFTSIQEVSATSLSVKPGKLLKGSNCITRLSDNEVQGINRPGNGYRAVSVTGTVCKEIVDMAMC